MNVNDLTSILPGTLFDFVSLGVPKSFEHSKITSKLSPVVGNLIEFEIVDMMNDSGHWPGTWRRQDPAFPDAVYYMNNRVITGVEVKAWFPLSTEMTARFRESQTLMDDSVHLCVLAWLPEFKTHGRPMIRDVGMFPALEIARCRDDKYFNAPDYLVVEPFDTSSRTKNLQQSNVAGYKWQGVSDQWNDAVKMATDLGLMASYSIDIEYQNNIRKLMSAFPYRLDTNFGKLNRLGHIGLETFRDRVMENL